MGAAKCLIWRMPLSSSRRNRRPPTWRDYYSLQIILWGIMLLGPAFAFHALYADHRDRPSLQWPKTSGVILQCNLAHQGLRQTYYHVVLSYAYVINGQRH